MSRAARRFLALAVVSVGGSGLVLGWMVFLLPPPDAWSVVNHPAQPTVQHLHVLAAPLLVFAVGLIWSTHVAARWSDAPPRRRATGAALAALFVLMAASAYLLQVAVDPDIRRLWSLLHTAASLGWLLCLGLHAVPRSRSRSPGARAPGIEPTGHDPPP